MPLIKLLHATIAKAVAVAASDLQVGWRSKGVNIIWPNNKVVTEALGPSLIDLLPGACFSKSLETFQAQRQILKSKPVTNQSLCFIN